MKKCYSCGDVIYSNPHPVKGNKEAVQCADCFAMSMGISPEAYREAQEIDPSDLEAAADAFDRLKAGIYYEGYKKSDFLENKQNDTKN